MKRVVFFLMIIVFMTETNSQTIVPSEKRLEEFTRVICSSATRLSRGDSVSKAGSHIEEMFIREFGIDKNDPNYKQLVAAVYNKYAACLICRDKPTPHTRNPEQFLKRVISLGMYEFILYDFLLYDEEEYPIDVNTIEILPNGEKETLLDYVDKILADPNVAEKYDVKEIQSLRRVIIKDYNAKKASDLKD